MNRSVTRVAYAIWLFVLLVIPQMSSATEVSVRPFLIDVTLEPRGISDNTVVLKSDYTDRKALVYATVNEITVDTEGVIKEFVSPVMTDRTNTVTSWIEVRRGRIEVQAGETVEVPVTIRVHPYAEPGEYHAFIGFIEAANRPKAEAIAMAGEGRGVVVKVTIADKRDESMRITSFSVDRFVTGDDDRTVDIEIENIGDVASAPKGEMIFYDSRGVEVTSLPINEEGVTVPPGEKVTLKSQVPLENELGRFKANVSLDYGKDQTASLHDTTFFYMMPWDLLLLIFGAVLFVAISLALLFRRVFIGKVEDADDYHEVTMYVKDGHDPQPKDHDIDLKNRS